VFVDGLAFPTGICVWDGGLVVGCAPDILYFRDVDGDGRADQRRVLFTGFGRKNIQQLVNSLQFEVDNWIYGANGGNTGDVTLPQQPGEPPVPLGGRFFRLRMSDLVLEPMSGGGQYGLAADDFQRWFTCSNSRHLNHIVLPDHYLRRNPYFAAPAVMLDIPDHGAAARLFRASPPEAWRVARTKMRAEGAERSRFALTELVPAGYVTGACGNTIYRGGLFPDEYRGNSFVCDAANNLVHRDLLEPSGPTFIARRAVDEQESEFLTSTDNWFRPVTAANGPDGALYVVDFYRQVVETPLSLPDEIKQNLDLEAGHDRGRIWRIVPEDYPPNRPLPRLARLSAAELVEQLDSPHAWMRLTAQRLLIERQNRSIIPHLERLAREAARPTGRLHALWTLEGLSALGTPLIERALEDESAGVREQAIRLAEPHLQGCPALLAKLFPLGRDPDARVRFQLAFTLGNAPHGPASEVLVKIAERDWRDPWMRAAVISSATAFAPRMLGSAILDQAELPADAGDYSDLIAQLAEIIGAQREEKIIAELLEMIALGAQADRQDWRLPALDGLAAGLRRGGTSLRQVLDRKASLSRDTLAEIGSLLDRAAVAARDGTRSDSERVAALRLLGQGLSASQAPELAELLTAQTPPPVQSAALRALSALDSPDVGKLLMANWRSQSPAVRREVQEALFARANRLPHLLAAIESGEVSAADLDAARRDQLLIHADSAIRTRAQTLLASLVTPDRQQVIDEHNPVLTLPGDAARGKAVFKKHCATCHRIGGEGVEVGADLTAVRTKTREMLLIDILDPSRNMEPRFTNYVIATKSGQVLTGMIVAETAVSITLRRAELAEDSMLRSDIDEIRSTGKSLMPDGLEKEISQQDVADLMEFLRSE
jgi:putative membrane-bound dehydrogenase-like protein